MYKLTLFAILILLTCTSCDEITDWLESRKNDKELVEYRITSISFYEGNNSYEAMKQEIFYKENRLDKELHIYRNSSGVITDTILVNYTYQGNEVTEDFVMNGSVKSRNIYEVNDDLLVRMEQSYKRNGEWKKERKHLHTYLNDTLLESKTYLAVQNSYQLNSRYRYDFFNNNRSKWKRYNDIDELISQNTYYHNNETLDSMVLYTPDATMNMLPILKEYYTYSGGQLTKITHWNQNQNQWIKYNTTTYEYHTDGLLKSTTLSRSGSSETVKYTWEKGESNYSTLKIDPAIRQTGISVLKGEVKE